ncbi:MMPL family transporter [Actinomadura hibisca]|uniref:MMPL family transporter n=1 Tax=Actinomadura hibisca TaxID=68565 RepID=UPI00083040A7|nr:efflux RND transporter permease subunit [Actinomadura hibisca]
MAESSPPGRRWFVIIGWLVLAAGSLALVPALLGALGAPSLRVAGSPSAQAAELLGRGFPQWGDEQVVVAFDSPVLDADDPDYLRAVAAGLTALAARPGVGGVQALPPTSRQNSHHLYVLAGLHGDEAARYRRLPEQQAALRDRVAQASQGRVRAGLVGVSPVFTEVKDADLADVQRAELIAAPLALLVLWAGLRRLRLALVPLVMAGVATVVAVGVLTVAHLVWGLRLDTLMLTVACSASLGLGLDYALLVLLRFRRAVEAGADRRRAVRLAMATAGRTVLWCGLAVICTACCMFTVRADLIKTLAVPAVVAALVAAAVAVTLLPALLAAFGDRIVAGYGSTASAGDDEGGWARWARHLMRHPWRYLAAGTAVLALAALPALGMRFGMDYDRPSFAHTEAGRFLAQMEGDGMASLEYLLLPHAADAGPVDTFGLTAKLEADPRFTLTAALDNGRDLTMVLFATAQPPDRPDSALLLDDLRRDGAASLPAGQPLLVSGPTAMLADLTGESMERLWRLGVLVLGCSLVLLVAALRSVLLPVKAVLLNVLAVAAALGLTSLAFDGAPVNALLPVAVFTIVFGLSMDYEVFLVHRIAEHHREHGDNTAAVAHGLRHTARTITLAAAVMIVTFAALLTSHRLELRQIAFATAVAVAIDVTVIRLVLVPALMQLLGRRNWWLPAVLVRVLPQPTR